MEKVYWEDILNEILTIAKCAGIKTIFYEVNKLEEEKEEKA